jgi:hypothetical protein
MEVNLKTFHLAALRVATALVGLIAGCDSSSMSAHPSQTTSTNKVYSKVYEQGQSVHVGYMSYAVWSSRWTYTSNDNTYLDTPPNAMYLVVNLTVRNNDRKGRTVPSFSLVDELGREYGTSDKSWRVSDAIGMIENLNPDVSKQRNIVFDVPRGRIYKLKVSGGYWSSESALIALNPPSPEQKTDPSTAQVTEKAPGSTKAKARKAPPKKPPPVASSPVPTKHQGFPSEDPSIPWACNKATYDADLCTKAMAERR